MSRGQQLRRVLCEARRSSARPSLSLVQTCRSKAKRYNKHIDYCTTSDHYAVSPNSIVVPIPRHGRHEEGQHTALEVIPRIADVDVKDGTMIGTDACQAKRSVSEPHRRRGASKRGNEQAIVVPAIE